MKLSLLGQQWQGPEESDAGLSFESVHPALWGSLGARGLRNDLDLRRFLEPDISLLRDERGLQDMDKAIDLVLQTMKKGGRICIFGDYDADGLSGAAVLYGMLKPVYENFGVYLPRRTEGYGLGQQGLENLGKFGVDLLITVDNGTTAHQSIGIAQSMGMKVIVTDHHQPEEHLPGADALINPHRADCTYGFRGLSGCAVAFKLGLGVLGALGRDREEALASQVDLVGLSLLSDKMPLVDENRYFSKAGLCALAEGRRPGLRALLKHIGKDLPELTAYDLDFFVIPRLNASGRLDTPMTSFALLVSEDEKSARPIAKKLEETNTERRKIQEDVLRQVRRAMRGNTDELVIASGKWHFGVLGVVASKISDEHQKPTLLLCPGPGGESEGKLKGSGRNPTDINFLGLLRDALAEGLLSKAGGHHAAMGVELDEKKLGEFQAFMQARAKASAAEEKPLKTRVWDGPLHLRDTAPGLLSQLQSLEPFGKGNPMPVFHLSDLKVKKAVYRGSFQEHLKLEVQDERGDKRQVMFFGAGRLAGPNELEGRRIDLAVEMSRGDYPGDGPVSLKAQDLMLHG